MKAQSSGFRVQGSTFAPLVFALFAAFCSSLAAQTVVPTKLEPNADGSVTIHFKGEAGAAYQIFYADSTNAVPTQLNWSVAVDNITAAEGFTEWTDQGDATRPSPAKVQQRYYRVVKKLSQAVAPPPATGQPPPGTAPSAIPEEAVAFLGVAKAKPLTDLEELAEIAALIAGGEETEAELIQKLAETPLSVAKLMELALNEWNNGNRRVAQLIYEAIIGPKAKDATKGQLAEAYLCIGVIYYQLGRNEESADRLEEAARLAPKSAIMDEALAAACVAYWNLEKHEESRRVLNQLLKDHSRDGFFDYALLLLGQTYVREKKWTEAEETFDRLEREQRTKTFGLSIAEGKRECAKHKPKEAAGAKH
jgi:tetratricopeptide (TPR) repeat protein